MALRTHLTVLMLIYPLSLYAADRKTADGVDLPDCDPKPLPTTFPGIAAYLGQRPEDAIKDKIYSISNKKLPVKHWVEAIEKNQVCPSPGFVWISRGTFGADSIIFALTNGRISGVVFVIPTLTNEKAKALLMPLQKVGKTDQDWVWNIKGLRINAALLGLRDSGDGQQYPCAILLQVNPIDWYLVYHETAADVAAAMCAGVPAKGMTKEGALLVFGEPVKQSDKVLIWERRKAVITSGGVEGYNQILAAANGGTPTHVYRRVIMTFEDGVCSEFSDESDK